MNAEPTHELTISSRADPAYVAAFRTLSLRVARSAKATVKVPITMFLAGGAAMHFYTGTRMTDDIDAVFDRKILVPSDSTVLYRDTQGNARSVYFDMNYNESFALLHEDAHEDAWRLRIDGMDAVRVLVLQPVDLALSKLSRFSEIDRGDILQLAKGGLITSNAVRQRAEEALPGYVGNLVPLRTSIMLACRDIDALPGHTGP
jgi:hypothetical protein